MLAPRNDLDDPGWRPPLGPSENESSSFGTSRAYPPAVREFWTSRETSPSQAKAVLA